MSGQLEVRRDPVASRPRRVVAATAIAIALLLGGCAPHLVRVAEIEASLSAARYRAALAERETRGVSVDAELLLWGHVPSATRIPGAEARLLLAGPDAFRLRVGSLFGTALDIAARGDSLSAYVPARRTGLRLDAARDSLGLLGPGGLGFRALSGAWRPPPEAWEAASRHDALLRVTWLEDADTLAVAVGSDGLPAWASLTRPGGTGVRIDYRAWDRSAGLAWPARFDFTDLAGGYRLECKVARVRFPSRPDPLRFSVPIPADAERLTLAGLRRALERLGSL
jgi:hypothetical protein